MSIHYGEDDHEQHVVAGNENLQVCSGTFVDYAPDGGTAEFGSITAAATGVPNPVFNRIFVFDAPSETDLAAAVEWMSTYEVPYLVTVSEPEVDAVAALAGDLGLVDTGMTHPGMVLPSLDDIPETESPATIDSIRDGNELEEFTGVLADVFDTPPGVVKELLPDGILDDETMEMFLARVDGQPVACGQLVRTDNVAGIYSVGVVENYRRQGIGEAMTAETLQASREAGCEISVLQSSEMAYSLYEQMGFETVTEIQGESPAL